MLTEWQINQEMNRKGYYCDKLTANYVRYYNDNLKDHVVIFKKGKHTKKVLTVLCK